MFLDDIVFELLKTRPFYGHMFRQCRITLDDKLPSPAAVAVNRGIEMFINKDKLSAMPLSLQAGVIEHELQHLFHDHIEDYNKIADIEAELVNRKKSHKAFNIAADCQINPSIKALTEDPNMGLAKAKEIMEFRKQFKTHEEFEAAVKEQGKENENSFMFPEMFEMKNGEHWSTYYKALLLKYQPKDLPEMYASISGKSGSEKSDGEDKTEGEGNPTAFDEDGMPKGHDHSYFEKSIKDQKLRDEIVAKAAERAKKQNYGNSPQLVDSYIIEVEKRKKLPWNVLLRQFLHSQVSINRRKTWKRQNRRLPEQIPGYKRLPKLKILVGLDASGSVGDKQWAAFFNEIDGIRENDVEIWIAEFDTEIANYYKYEGKPEPRKTNGGTDFRCVHKKALDENFKAVVYLTDGYGGFPDPKTVTYKTLWVMDSDQKAPYGFSIKMELPND